MTSAELYRGGVLGPATPRPPWPGETVRLVTRHAKAVSIAPALARVGLAVTEADEDTDALGTFSGTVPRTASPTDIAAQKASLGLARSSARLGAASEGTFGPWLGLPMLTADQEVVVVVDRQTGTVFRGGAVRAAAVAVSATVAPGHDLSALLARADLPRHRLVVRPAGRSLRPHDASVGIGTVSSLRSAIRHWSLRSPRGEVEIVTDFRAHVCPSRREVIAEAATDLVRRLGSRCPACAGPGWGIERKVAGAPCTRCATPTETVRSAIWACPGCPHRDEYDLSPPRGADPSTCPHCNP